MNRWPFILISIMVGTTIAGELSINPFFGSFRIGMGGVVFFFLLLLLKPAKLPLVGIATGLFVSVFRTALDLLSGRSDVWMDSFLIHLPAAWYYIAFASLLSLVRMERSLPLPAIFGAIGGVIDVASNVCELLARFVMNGANIDLFRSLYVVAFFGFLRSYLVVGLYTMLEFRQLRAVSKEQQTRMEKLLMILSELHEDRLYLQKMMDDVEHITATSYRLYRSLNGLPQAVDALRLTENVHEVKKDTQRIFSGISKLIKQEAVTDRMKLYDVVKLVVKANAKYAEHIQKKVIFQVNVQGDWCTSKIYSFLSLLNNIVTNSVEAIIFEGTINITIYSAHGDIHVVIRDDGPGIPREDRELIFQPGFTSKYDAMGNASTGVGLSHVLSTLSELSGRIEVADSPSGGALFSITVPENSL